MKGLIGLPSGQGSGLLGSPVPCPEEGQGPAVFGDGPPGVRRNACCWRLITPEPTIWPASLIAFAPPNSVQPAARTSGRVLKSCIPDALDHKNGLPPLTPTT